jgi:hypothetical protein
MRVSRTGRAVNGYRRGEGDSGTGGEGAPAGAPRE